MLISDIINMLEWPATKAIYKTKLLDLNGSSWDYGQYSEVDGFKITAREQKRRICTKKEFSRKRNWRWEVFERKVLIRHSDKYPIYVFDQHVMRWDKYFVLNALIKAEVIKPVKVQKRLVGLQQHKAFGIEKIGVIKNKEIFERTLNNRFYDFCIAHGEKVKYTMSLDTGLRIMENL